MNLRIEKYYWKKGYKKIIGLDEAGRGPLAGPVTAAAVLILLPNKISLLKNEFFRKILLQARDSKKLSPKKREEIFRLIQKCSLIQFSHALVNEKVIDKINIEQATFKAMGICLKKLKINQKTSQHCLILVDGNRSIPKINYLQKTIIKGDDKILSIALASIIAKVIRDKIMITLAKKYPHYHFEIHKGYPTKLHRKLLKKYGPCKIHRKSYKPVRIIIQKSKLKLKIKNSNRKLLVILGPTASGKSDLAIKIAKLFNGEIISADSRQVYRGMDIGTGKVPRDKTKNTSYKLPDTSYYSEGIRHHLLDVADPKEYFSAAQYQKLAYKAIKEVQKKNKLPIFCGGTGLYLSAIIEGWQFPNVPPNAKLRQELEGLNTGQLFQKLRELDPKRAATIDKNNRRRLIRALEIIYQDNIVSPLKKKPLQEKILILGIKKDKEELQKLISKRLEKRLSDGMLEEVKKIKENGVSSKRLDDFGLEYRWLNRYLEKKITLLEMKEELYRDSCRYAKRQMTWFKKIPNVHWVTNDEEAIKLASDFLSN